MATSLYVFVDIKVQETEWLYLFYLSTKSSVEKISFTSFNKTNDLIVICTNEYFVVCGEELCGIGNHLWQLLSLCR